MFKKLFCAYASRRENAPTDLQNDPYIQDSYQSPDYRSGIVIKIISDFVNGDTFCCVHAEIRWILWRAASLPKEKPPVWLRR